MEAFHRSYELFKIYPENLVQSKVSKRTLTTYVQLLHQLSSNLFVEPDDSRKERLAQESAVEVLDFDGRDKGRACAVLRGMWALTWAEQNPTRGA
jgi:hypothetical protein